MDNKPDSSPDDPLGLQRVDRDIRIENLRREIQEVAGEAVFCGKTDDCDPALEETFLEHVLALEQHGSICPFEVLEADGFSLPSPDELNDLALSSKLWELIQALAQRRLFLHSTDHLSDRALYCWLWQQGLREELMGFGLPFGDCHLDLLGSGSEEDITLRMRYYADADERASFAAEFPDFQMPMREKPPFKRDQDLPRPEPPA